MNLRKLKDTKDAIIDSLNAAWKAKELANKAHRDLVDALSEINVAINEFCEEE